MMAKGVANSKAMRVGSLQVTGTTADGVLMKASEVADMTEEVIPTRTNFGETAFFYPKVETDEEGTAELTFTLPESLTSWRFMGLAHDKEMRIGTIDTTVIAHKQLMVQPNMPRFLRIGDKATITANITNSSADESQITVKCYVGRKNTSKKDLARMMMQYPNVTVSQISMGANMNQAIKAINEAKEHKGPSLIIAYAPCINHGIKKGMGKSQLEEKLAVECGYWHTFRFNPMAENKFTLDSKAPNFDKYKEFLDGEVRYSSLALKNKERASELDAKNQREAMARYNYLKALGELYAVNTSNA
jgi:aspartate carbamoyltransferase regulatory subunit